MRLGTELSENMTIALDAIRSNKLRSALATLGIVIGVVTVTLMGTAITGLNNAFKSSISQLGTDVLFVQKFDWGPGTEWWKIRNRRDITLDQARRAAREVTLAVGVSIEAQRSSTVAYRDRTARGVFTVGNTEESAFVRGLVVREGRFFTPAEVDGARPVCVLGAEVADRLFPRESALGRKVRIENRPFEVVGVIDKMGQFLFGNLDNQIIVPITRFLTDLAWRPEVMMMVKVGDETLLDEAEAQLRGILRKVRRVPPGAPDDFSINRQQVLLDAFNRVGGTVAAAGLFITGLSLFVGGIGVMNIMYVSVVERTREIGIRKAIGARRRTILMQFLLEAAMICLAGGLLALVLAYPLTLLIGRALPATLSWPVAALALTVSVVTGLVAGFLPARRAAGMNPVDALRAE
jgi:putative ABC transport system permease protein